MQPADHPASVAGPRLLAVSDLHVGFAENRQLVAGLRSPSAADWLIVAGDVGEFATDIEWALGTLRERFAQVIWVPGNHELWTHRREPVRLRGAERYQHLVDMCRRLGVLTPEDPYPVWTGQVRNGSGDESADAGQAVIVPMFLLYDYSFLPEGTTTKVQGLERAYASGVVANDEALLHPDPYPSREAWCAARLEETERRLADLPAGSRTILVNHYPLIREPTRVLRYPLYAQWCGTVRTADWHQRYNAAAVVYGHLHIPRTTWHDGVPHQEVSLGYPREWRRRKQAPVLPHQVLPSPG
jgi:3',5'-cyclic AMP phosphodiesterase CpdA